MSGFPPVCISAAVGRDWAAIGTDLPVKSFVVILRRFHP
jgi:hypothetical protein